MKETSQRKHKKDWFQVRRGSKVDVGEEKA